VADVEAGYWALAEAEATQAVLQHSVDIAEALLFRNQQLADRHLVPDVDVLTARSAVALRRSGLIAAQQAREDAAERLVFLAWGEDAPTRFAASAVPLKTVGAEALPIPAPPDSLQRAVAAALDVRQDVAAARAAVRAAEEARRATHRAILPSLDLTGALSTATEGASLGNSVGALGGRPSWSLGLSFSQPILNRRDRGTDVESDLAVTLRRLDLALAENNARLEVSAARRALLAGTRRLAAAAEAASLATAQLDAERHRLDLGLGDSFRLLQTEDITVQSQLESVRARFDLARAGTDYRLATGAGGGS
jgi:outer membrane protein